MLLVGHPFNSFYSTVVELCLAFWEFAKVLYIVDGKSKGKIHPAEAVIRLLRMKHCLTRETDFGPLSPKTFGSE